MSSTPLPPPGWHNDPHDTTSLRYWDGAQWTEHRAQATPPPPVQSAGVTSANWPAARLAALGGAAAIIVGSFSPWVTVATAFGSISVSGTTDGGDGLVSLAGGAIIALLIATSKYLAAIIVSVLTGALLLYDLINVNRVIGDGSNEFATASVGWGLWLATVGVVLAFGTSLQLNRLKIQQEKPHAGGWHAPRIQ